MPEQQVLEVTEEQRAAWERAAAADGTPLEVWLVAIANRAAMVSPSEPIVVKLRKPIPFGAKEIVEEIAIRPIKARDLRLANEAEGMLATTLKFASILSGKTPKIIDELEGDDLRDVLAAVNLFFHAIRRTGRTSSET